MTQPTVDCIICDNKFTEEDCINLRFFLSTKVCYKCYRKLQKQDKSISCFGKEYNANAEECRELCPDKRICPHFSSGFYVRLHTRYNTENSYAKITKPTEQQVARAYPFRSGSLADRAFKICNNGVDISRLRKWCLKKNTSYYRLIRAFRKQARNGKVWKLNETKTKLTIRYPI